MDEPIIGVVAGTTATVLRYGPIVAVLTTPRPGVVGPVCETVRRLGLERGSADVDIAAALVDAFAAAGDELRGAALVLAADGADVVLSGDMPVRAETLVGELHLNGRSAPGPVRQPLTGSFTQVRLGEGEGTPDAWLDLGAGTVPGAGVVVVLEPLSDQAPADAPAVLPAEGLGEDAPPTERLQAVHPVEAAPPSTEPLPSTDPSPSEPAPPVAPEAGDGAEVWSAPFESLSLVGAALPAESTASRRPLPVEEPGSSAGPSTEPAADPTSTPASGPASEPATDLSAEPSSAREVVQGLRCGRGHFNHPHAANCVWCGLGMVQVSHVLVPGERPTLGVLVINGQTTFTLDADYVLGRQPRQDPDVDGDRVRELVLADTDRSISRVHASVRLRGWDVLVEDRGSGNGTWVEPTDGNAPAVQVLPGEPYTLRPGEHIRIGPHRLTFHSHHVR